VAPDRHDPVPPTGFDPIAFEVHGDCGDADALGRRELLRLIEPDHGLIKRHHPIASFGQKNGVASLAFAKA
jgi:hypothetical protein